ncbi:D-alanyl-D-alanine carboxypeptidase family protein [Leucobacter denitrificans]|uniref:Peptidase S11 D-alanyl-D-alanine carboxypeptidase A N-terminal domain-containing protein n=1 Tax=Leucobacter denitrificans TaxID=683042 RepID=A0A7G9S286_9MICO|nr:hypothetical protein [Leucobacter denitrificans]QNN61961.1 hypothetical protein H9L06_06430 [Leucobacter denitrificans]
MSTAPRRFSQRRRRRLFFTSLVAVLLLGSGGYVAEAAMADLPEPTLALASAETAIVEADPSTAQAVVDAQTLPTAIGWADDDDVWSNDDETHPLGSITKLIMVLVSMDEDPLEPGTEGETYTWTAEDAELTNYYIAQDGVAFYIPVGAELTQRDMLKFIFLPSANDVAHSYALWRFGSIEAFLEKLEAWKIKYDLPSITLVEPTGMDTKDQANPADLVRVARLALEIPAIAELNGMQTAEMPWGIGTIENSNPLLGSMPGIVGTKTGTIYSSYNFVVSQHIDVDGREATSIAVTLDRASKEDRAASGREVLTAMGGLASEVSVVKAGEQVATLTSVDGQVAPLVADGEASAVLLPGETAERSISADASSLTVTGPAGETAIPIVRTSEFSEPDLWWRITNPGLVFG